MDLESEDEEGRAEIEALLYAQIYHSSLLELPPANHIQDNLIQPINEPQFTTKQTPGQVQAGIDETQNREATKKEVSSNLSTDIQLTDRIKESSGETTTELKQKVNNRNNKIAADLKSNKNVTEKYVISDTESNSSSDLQIVEVEKSAVKTPTLPSKRPVIHTITSDSDSDDTEKLTNTNRSKQQKFQTTPIPTESSSDSHHYDGSSTRSPQPLLKTSKLCQTRTAHASKIKMKVKISSDSGESAVEEKTGNSKRSRNNLGISSDESSSDDGLPFWAHIDNKEHEGDRSITTNTVKHNWKDIYDRAMSVNSDKTNSDFKQNTLRDKNKKLIWNRVESLEDILCDMSDTGWTINLDDKYSNKSKSKRYCNLKCNNCNEKGHLAVNCPEPLKKRPCMFCSKIHTRTSRGYYHGAGASRDMSCPDIICVYCGDAHLSMNCMKKKGVINTRCRRCSQFGHFEKNCHELWRQWFKTYDMKFCKYPLKTDNVTRMVRKTCSICAGRDHLNYECKSIHFTQLPPLSPIIRCFNEHGKLSSFPYKYTNTSLFKNNTRDSNHYDSTNNRPYNEDLFTTPDHMKRFNRDFSQSEPSHHVQNYSKRKHSTNSKPRTSYEPPTKQTKRWQTPTPHRHNFSDEEDYKLALRVKKSKKNKTLMRSNNTSSKLGKSKIAHNKDNIKLPFKGGSSKTPPKRDKSRKQNNKNDKKGKSKLRNKPENAPIEDNFQTKLNKDKSNAPPQITQPINGKISFTDKHGRFKPKAFDKAAKLAAEYQQQKNKGSTDTRRKVSKRNRLSAPF